MGCSEAEARLIQSQLIDNGKNRARDYWCKEENVKHFVQITERYLRKQVLHASAGT